MEESKKNRKLSTLKEMMGSIGSDAYDLKALSMKLGEDYFNTTYGELKNYVELMGSALLNKGIKKGDTIGIISENRIEWPLVYLGVSSIGAVIVPLDPALKPDEVETAVAASDCAMIVVSNYTIDKLANIEWGSNNLKQVICLDKHEKTNDTAEENAYVYFQSLLGTGQELMEKGQDLLSGNTVEPEDVAAMIHMHGSTFAMLTHKGLMANAYGLIDHAGYTETKMNPGDKSLACLPFHHTLQAMLGFLTPLLTYGNVVILVRFELEELIAVINELDIRFMPSVPYLVEALCKTMKLKNLRIPSMKLVMNGGASTHKSISKEAEALGVPLFSGYGLSECAPIATAEKPGYTKYASVGIPFNNMEIKIANPGTRGNGEVLIKGPSVMKGYYKKPELTKAVIDEEGWLHTGDIGKIDEDGYLFITGRIKNIIVNKGGKNIFPEDPETALLKSEYISQAVVVPRIDPIFGESPFAIIHPNVAAFTALEKETGKRMGEDDTKKFLSDEIKKVNEAISGYKKARNFEISYTPLPVESIKNELFMFEDFYLTEVEKKTGDQPAENSGKNETLLQKIQTALILEIETFFQIGREHISMSNDLGDYGFDSMSLISFVDGINEKYNLTLNPAVFIEYDSIEKVSLYLEDEHSQSFQEYFQAGTRQELPVKQNDTVSNERNKIDERKETEPVKTAYAQKRTSRGGQEYFMGIDAGSTTIKTVVVNQHGEICNTSYERTTPGEGKPVQCSGNCERCGRCSLGSLKNIVTAALAEINLNLNDISNIVVTGSQITPETRDVIPYNFHVSEVNAHVSGALRLHPDCKAILDVGGQDSKSMMFDEKLGNWTSKMSGICAAGTGAFLDSVAGKLGITVESMEDIADYNSTLDFSSVCAVFAATSINKFKNRYSLGELVGGACAAQARTVMSGVGELFQDYSGTILFQGGVASNKVVAHYLAEITGNKIVVPEQYKVMGAFGAACLAREHIKIEKTLSTESFFTANDMKKKSVTMRSRMVIKDFFAYKKKPFVWRNLFYPIEVLNALDCSVLTLESRAALAAQNRKEVKASLDKAAYKGYGAETCSFLRVLEGMDLPDPVAGVSTSQPCQQGERILRDLVYSKGKKDSFYSLNTPIDSGPNTLTDLARDIEQSIHCLEKSLGRKMDMGRLAEAFEYSNQARKLAMECNDLRRANVPLIPGRVAINFANILSQGWGTQEFVDIQKQYRIDLLEQKDKLEGRVSIEDTHRLVWLHLSPFYNTNLMDYIEDTCNAPIVMEEVNSIRWDALDISNPYESLAKKILNSGFLNMEMRFQNVVEEVKRSSANGVVLYNHMFGRCAMSDITVIRGLRESLEEVGIPLLVLDGDCIDPTIDPCSTYTKVQSYVEVLNDKKFN
ncbi:MAG: AMP-binding protein, partial [bacterium]|nr:AMP-binding protein [bacterium]